MATENSTRYTELKARVEAMKGFRLFVDDSVEGHAQEHINDDGEDGPRYYIYNVERDRIVCIGRGVDIVDWIEQNGSPGDGNDDEPNAGGAEDEQSIRYTLLRHPKGEPHGGRLISDAIFSIRALGRALEADNDDDPNVHSGLCGAMVIVGDMLSTALMNVESADEDRIRQALLRPDSDREAMAKRLRGTGYELWCHPTTPNDYAVGDNYGKWQLAHVSLGEIDRWLESEGIETKGNAA